MIPAKLEEFPSFQALKRLNGLESLERLQNLERLDGLTVLERLQIYCDSYDRIPIPPDAVIYADIPYEGTACDIYDTGFDHAAFLDWAAKQDRIYISSYEINDPRFVCVWEQPKAQLSNGKGYGAIKMERIYTKALSGK